MIANKKIEKCIRITMLICVTVSVLFMKNFSTNVSTKGVSKDYESILNGQQLLDIQIDISDEKWKQLTQAASEKKYFSCDVTINGEALKGVGIRTKGDASLETVVEMGNSDRYSLMLNFDKYVDGQNYHGLTKLSLNNMISDYSQMRDSITYDMSKHLGLPASLYSYAKITKNGEYFGCYLALEPVDKVFCERNFGTTLGALYDPVEGGAEDESKQGAGGNLNYTDDKVSSYSEIFNDAKFGSTKETKQAVIKALKAVNDNNKIEASVDVDKILKYLAVQSIAENLDSLTGSAGHNNFLYVVNGKISLIPWDFNLAYGLYQDGGEDEELEDDSIDWGNLSDEELKKLEEQMRGEEESIDFAKQTSQYVNFPIDTPFTTKLENRRFFMKLLENPEYLHKYHSYLKLLAENYIQGGELLKTMNRIQQQTNDLVGTEANAFITNDIYKTAVAEFYKLMSRRAETVLKQLNGELPSTFAGQLKEPEKIVDSKDINLQLTGME